MDLGPHAAFIILAYGVAVIVITALIVWTITDHRLQTRMLRDLERRGVSRRSPLRGAEGP